MSRQDETLSKVCRREFIKKSSLAAGFAVGSAFGLAPWLTRAATRAATGNRVVWARNPGATFWNGTGYYGDSVNQSVVDALVADSMKALTGTQDGPSAWRSIISGYTTGKKIVIKVNLNNTINTGYSIDASPGPVNGVIAGLKSMGVAEPDIYVLDTSRVWPSHIATPILSRYPNVLLWDSSGQQGHRVTFDLSPTAATTLHLTHAGIPDSNFPLQLAEASYLIHMPILKGHGSAEISLTFKNLFGMVMQGQCASYHDYALPWRSGYSYDQNPLHDLYRHPLVMNKTVLIVGDGLFGQRAVSETGTPSVWTTFGGQFPNSIFLSTDPVAIDSVMFDFLNAEIARYDGSQLYLHRAQELGLGTHEHWNNPTDKRYSLIDFQIVASDPGARPTTPQGLRRTDVISLPSR